jgi:hypothetical protein
MDGIVMPRSLHNFLNSSGGIPLGSCPSSSVIPIDLMVSSTAIVALGILLRKVYACTPIWPAKTGLPLWAKLLVVNKLRPIQAFIITDDFFINRI